MDHYIGTFKLKLSFSIEKLIMSKFHLVILCAFFFQEINAQQISVIKFDELHKIIHSNSTSIQVINFWATWCGPCVKELPLFEKLHKENKEGIKVTLINLDFADKLKRVKSFVAHKQMKAEVFLLDEIDYNQWIHKVDKHWGGAIPATLVINHQNGKRMFVEREMKEGELEKLIEEVR